MVGLVIFILSIACCALYAEMVALKKRVTALEDLEPYQVSKKVVEIEKKLEKLAQRTA